MCTLTFAWQAFPDAPLVVAANRDEVTDRPSSGPRTRDPDGDGPRVLAPRDDLAGGTWMGVSDAGVFAGITNRWTDAKLTAGRSRGLLVDEALAAPSAADAADVVRRAVEVDDYAGFYLVLADARDAILLAWDGDLVETRFDPGVHVVVNVGADDDFDVPEFRREVGEEQAAKARQARAELAVDGGESAEHWRERARVVLGDHEYDLCVHGDGYGTRSASLVTLWTDGGVDFAYAPGPPCETDFETVEHDL